MKVTAYKGFCDDDFAAASYPAHPNPSKIITDRKDGAVSYFRITKCKIGFREAARLVKIAEETGSIIRLVAGRATGNSSSVLSIIKMGIEENTPVAVRIMHGDTQGAFTACANVLDGL